MNSHFNEHNKKIDQYHNEADSPVQRVVSSFYLVGLIIYQQSNCEHGLEIAPTGFKNVQNAQICVPVKTLPHQLLLIFSLIHRIQECLQGFPWLRICCSQEFSQMGKVGAK